MFNWYSIVWCVLRNLTIETYLCYQILIMTHLCDQLLFGNIIVLCYQPLIWHNIGFNQALILTHIRIFLFPNLKSDRKANLRDHISCCQVRNYRQAARFPPVNSDWFVLWLHSWVGCTKSQHHLKNNLNNDRNHNKRPREYES